MSVTARPDTVDADTTPAEPAAARQQRVAEAAAVPPAELVGRRVLVEGFGAGTVRGVRVQGVHGVRREQVDADE